MSEMPSSAPMKFDESRKLTASSAALSSVEVLSWASVDAGRFAPLRT